MALGATNNFLKGVSVQTVVAAVNAILQLTVFAVLSRLLTKEDFGYYAALFGITMIFMAISDAGIGSALIQKKDPSPKYHSTAFTLSVIVGFVMGGIFFFFAPLLADLILDDSITPYLRILSIPLLLCSVSGYASSVLRKQLKFKLLGICSVCSYFISSVIAIIVAYYGGGVVSLMVLHVLNSILVTILYYSQIPLPSFGIGRSESRGVISFGGWLTLGVIMSSISNQLDKLVLGKWLSVEKLGAYNRPSGFIAHIIGQFNTIFDSVLFPILSGFQDSKEQFRSIFYRAFELLSVFGILLACILFFNAPLIIMIFFGGQWLDLVGVMRISSLSAIFMLHNTLADCFFRSFNLVKAGFWIRSFGVLLSAVYIYLGAQYGIEGVAWAVLLANFIIVMVKLFYLNSRSGAEIAKMLQIFLRALIPAFPIFVIGVIFGFLPDNFNVRILFAVVTGAVLSIEMAIYPRILGGEYSQVIYPKVAMVIKNIKMQIVPKSLKDRP